MFKHILLPTDGSELSMRAVDMGIDIAVKYGASVFAIHAIKPLPAVRHVSDSLVLKEDEKTQKATRQAVSYLEEVHRRAEAAKVACRSAYEFDTRPYMVIASVARSEKCDLIVIGTHIETGMDRLLSGSQTAKLLVSTGIPVLVCR
ncbi:universal stress protein [Dyella telluris]|uniref:Universal stress protein n=1 Tax=Dyella telluris TaxID=2763498 RepID=A0A7G8Q645_9GAMM|nr:universal stress protein [Dyella telluris]QNK02253.1 universal stress protein [Dyella telluris]